MGKIVAVRFFFCRVYLTPISLALFLCDIGNKCKTRSDAASDLVLHFSLTDVSFKI